MPVVIAAALALLLAAWSSVRAAPVSAPSSLIEALAPAVQGSVDRTRPRHWPIKRACLYYALAGQALLAWHGVSSQLRVGDVVYAPGTARAYPISPHAWLESGGAFIDYATLPRWGRVTVIPAEGVAAEPSRVVPGVTQVLAVGAIPDPQLEHYLNHHARCFQGRSRAILHDRLP
jgi:hypothetical protein